MTVYDAAMNDVRISERRAVYRFGQAQPSVPLSLVWPKPLLLHDRSRCT